MSDEIVYTCPVNPEHDDFFGNCSESVSSHFLPNGDRDEDISNTYDSDGLDGPVYCYQCERSVPPVLTLALEFGKPQAAHILNPPKEFTIEARSNIAARLRKLVVENAQYDEINNVLSDIANELEDTRA